MRLDKTSVAVRAIKKELAMLIMDTDKECWGEMIWLFKNSLKKIDITYFMEGFVLFLS